MTCSSTLRLCQFFRCILNILKEKTSDVTKASRIKAKAKILPNQAIGLVFWPQAKDKAKS